MDKTKESFKSIKVCDLESIASHLCAVSDLIGLTDRMYEAENGELLNQIAACELDIAIRLTRSLYDPHPEFRDEDDNLFGGCGHWDCVYNYDLSCECDECSAECAEGRFDWSDCENYITSDEVKAQQAECEEMAEEEQANV